MDLLSFSTLYTTFFILVGLKDSYSYGVPCKHFEVIMCGDEDSEWSVCIPETLGVRRIISAQLDTRYRNRYCRKYGTPENFGLSASGRSMWTVGWCYGTFFLCLEIEHTSGETEDQGNGLGGFSPEHLDQASGASTSPGYDFHSPAVVESFMAAENDTESDYIDEEFIVETGPLETDEYITNDEYFESDMLQAGNNTHVGGNQELVYYGLDPRMKFWLIFGIVGGGVIVVVLICAVAYLTIQCCDDSNTEEVQGTRSRADLNRKYFRPHESSTSALVPSGPECFDDVYDIIPAAKLTSTASVKTEHELRDKQTHKDTYIQKNNKNSGQNKTYEVAEVHDARPSQKHNSLKRHEYFVLKPQNLEPENENGVVYTHSTENIYDRLVHTRTALKSDSSTYHCLNFQRDESESVGEGDVASSNENDEIPSDSSALLEENKDPKSENISNDKNVLSHKEIIVSLEKDLNNLTDKTPETIETKKEKVVSNKTELPSKVEPKRNSNKTELPVRSTVLQTDI